MGDLNEESQAILNDNLAFFAAAAATTAQQPSTGLPFQPASALPNLDDGFEFRPRPLTHARTEPSAMLRELAAAEGHILHDSDRAQPLGRPPRHPPAPHGHSISGDSADAAKPQEGSSSAIGRSFERQDTPGVNPPGAAPSLKVTLFLCGWGPVRHQTRPEGSSGEPSG